VRPGLDVGGGLVRWDMPVDLDPVRFVVKTTIVAMHDRYFNKLNDDAKKYPFASVNRDRFGNVTSIHAKHWVVSCCGFSTG
jgi:hypothetical protein